VTQGGIPACENTEQGMMPYSRRCLCVEHSPCGVDISPGAAEIVMVAAGLPFVS
jgi:hypothetical protein